MGRGSRGARIPPHSKHATRRTVGLEAAVVANDVFTIQALDSSDPRGFDLKVAAPAALLIAKLHKLGERRDEPHRLIDKDAHDTYRLLVATDTLELARTITQSCSAINSREQHKRGAEVPAGAVR